MYSKELKNNIKKTKNKANVYESNNIQYYVLVIVAVVSKVHVIATKK